MLSFIFTEKKNEKGASLAKTGRRIILLLINESQVVPYRPVSLGDSWKEFWIILYIVKDFNTLSSIFILRSRSKKK